MKRILSALTLTTLFLGITAFAVNSTDRTVKPNLDLEGNSSIKRVKEIEVKQLATGTTATVGYGNIYFKTNGLPYFKDSNGMETPLVASGAVGEWQSYTPTFQGFGTPTGVNALYRRVGDSIELQVSFTTGTTTATEARVSLPGSFTISSTKFTAVQNLGDFWGGDGNGTSWDGKVRGAAGDSYITFARNDQSGFGARNANNLVGTGFEFSFHATVPVTQFEGASGGPGPLVNEWQDFSGSVSFSGLGTTSTETVMGRRVGDSLQLVGYVLGGTPTASAFSIDLTGYTIDTTKCPVNHKAGAGISALNGTDFFASSGWSSLPFCDGSDNNSIFAGYQASGNNLAKMNGSDMISANKAIVFDVLVPISGWSGGFGSGGSTIYSARINNSGSCSVASGTQKPNTWISAASRPGAGQCSLTVSFQSAPHCWTQGINGVTPVFGTWASGVPSTTNVTTVHYDAAANLSDTDHFVFCRVD